MKRQTALALLAFIAVLLLLTTGCLSLIGREDTIQKPKYELTKHDVFARTGWTSSDISVLGVEFGDSMSEVTEKIGMPDLRTDYPNGASNFEYRESLTLNDTGLLIHFDNDSVTLFTVRPSMNRFLKGSTKIQHSKDAIFRRFGSPDNTTLLSYFTMYSYNHIGLDVHVSGKKEIGFSLKKVK